MNERFGGLVVDRNRKRRTREWRLAADAKADVIVVVFDSTPGPCGGRPRAVAKSP